MNWCGDFEMKVKTSCFGAAAVALLLLFGAGCASPNVNPPTARPNTGYVDFYTETNSELAWQVQRFDPAAKQFKIVFADLDPLKDPILRLAFAPGEYRFQVTFLNRVIAKPAQLDVRVEAGRIIPVQVTLTEAGTAFTQTKSTTYGSTIRGRIGRRTKVGSYETVMWNVAAVSRSSQPYQPKEQMNYAQKPTQ